VVPGDPSSPLAPPQPARTSAANTTTARRTQRFSPDSLKPGGGVYPAGPCPRVACRRLPGARRVARGPDVAARARAVTGAVGAPGRGARPGRDARGVDPTAARLEGRRPGGRALGAARDAERPRAKPRAARACDGIPRPAPDRRRSRSAVRHGLAWGGRPSANRVRPRRDRRGRAPAPPREALVHE